jgi:hypothetical protein
MEGIEQESRVEVKQVLLIGLVVIVGLAVIGGGIFVSRKALLNRKTELPVAVIPTVAGEPTKTVEATPTLGLVRADLKVEVLNGSGVAGLAAKAAAYLEEIGYKEVKTANASKYDYPETLVQVKENKKQYLGMVKEDVSKKYTLAAKTEILDEKSDFDVVIIVGKK